MEGDSFLSPFFMNKIFIFLYCLVLIDVYADASELYMSANSFSYSAPTSIQSIAGEWNDSVSDGSVGISHSMAETGFILNGYKFGLVERRDYQYRFNSETIQALYQINNSQVLDGSQQYKLYIDANSLIRRGLKFGYSTRTMDNLIFELSASVLKGYELVNGTIDGWASGGNSSHVAFDVDYIYSRDLLFNRISDEPDSIGYAFDFSTSWKPAERINLNLDIIDLLSEIKWFNAPATEATVDSDYSRYDANGYRQILPAASGQDSNRDFVQTIDPKTFLEARYRLIKNENILLKYHRFPEIDFVYMGYEYETDVSRFSASYSPQHKIVTLEYTINGNAFSFTTDDLAIHKAHAFGIGVNLHYEF